MRVLVIRTSAMGDVALVAPVIRALRNDYPELKITLVTKNPFLPFFPGNDSGIDFVTADFKGRHKGLKGVIRLFRDINAFGRYDFVADLHDVLRSKLLRILFRLKGIPVYTVDKQRGLKRELVKGDRTVKVRHSVEMYHDVFRRAGFPANLFSGAAIDTAAELPEWLVSKLEQRKLKIGIAPFARHKLKMWPREYATELIGIIGRSAEAEFFLFAGKEEFSDAEALTLSVPGINNLCGRLNLRQELALMKRLDFMIAMDTSNMHMAALSGAKTVSLWGATDPAAGFAAWKQPDEYAVRISRSELECRPCTVYGKGECRRGDFACMIWLTPEKVFKPIVELKLLEKNEKSE